MVAFPSATVQLDSEQSRSQTVTRPEQDNLKSALWSPQPLPSAMPYSVVRRSLTAWPDSSLHIEEGAQQRRGEKEEE